MKKTKILLALLLCASLGVAAPPVRPTTVNVTLAWDAPPLYGGAYAPGPGVTAYRLHVFPAKRTTGGMLIFVSGSATTTTVALNPGTAYDFYVTAIYGLNEESGPSNTVRYTTPRR